MSVTAATALAEPFAWKSASASARDGALAALRAATRHDDAATRGAAARALPMRFGTAEHDWRGGRADSAPCTRAPAPARRLRAPPRANWRQVRSPRPSGPTARCSSA
ncbi:MAG: hypothetical protein IPJ04_17135 [Candidatus Eisenbacteria bacterium]|nr:hypothetical protein [Candidatus Eisenbacteria bacterium]